jgi:hypothetical protein
MFPKETEFKELRPKLDESSATGCKENLYLKETGLYVVEFKAFYTIHCLFWIHFI